MRALQGAGLQLTDLDESALKESESLLQGSQETLLHALAVNESDSTGCSFLKKITINKTQTIKLKHLNYLTMNNIWCLTVFR